MIWDEKELNIVSKPNTIQIIDKKIESLCKIQFKFFDKYIVRVSIEDIIN